MAKPTDACDRGLITKDGGPETATGSAWRRRLLSVTAGHIGRDELLAIFARDLGIIGAALESAGMVELGQDSVKTFEEPEL